jgi:hypothetical protein
MVPRTFDEAVAELRKAPQNSLENRCLGAPTFRYLETRRESTGEEEWNAMKSKEWYDAYVAQLRAEGREEGREAGLRDAVTKQLQLKFGKLPGDVEQRVRGATAKELDVWIEKILEAERLKDVFACPLVVQASAKPSRPWRLEGRAVALVR